MTTFRRAGVPGEESAAPGTTAAHLQLTRDTESDRQTYDSLQLAAVLVTCEGCGRGFYMTHPKEYCAECRSKR